MTSEGHNSRFSALCLASLALVSSAAGQTNAVVWGDAVFGEGNIPQFHYLQAQAGAGFCIGLRDDHTLIGWGDNQNNQATPPAGTFLTFRTKYYQSVGIRTDGTLVQWGTGSPTVPPGQYVSVAVADFHCLALRADGSLVGWGSMDWRPFTGPPPGPFVQVDTGRFATLALRADGTIVAFGDSTFGQLDVPPGTYKYVAAGSRHAAAIRTDGTLVMWGGGRSWPTPTGTFRRVEAYESTAISNFHNPWVAAIRDDGSVYHVPEGMLPTPAGRFASVSVGVAVLGIKECDANCDFSTSAPILNANDFQCFLNEFASGGSYANCDGSTAPPVLNANDFQCFLNSFAQGCS